jgi:hypothetical protein
VHRLLPADCQTYNTYDCEAVMGDKHVPEDTATAQRDAPPSPILTGQILLVAIAIGIGTGSWRWGIGSLLGLAVALVIKPAAILLIMLLSLGWGIVGYEVGTSFDSAGARYILASVGFIVGLFVNSCGLAPFQEDL